MKKISSKTAITLPIIATLLFGFTALASANSELISNLTDTQKEALTQIHEIRQTALKDAKAVADQAGLTPEIIREYQKERRETHREAVKDAVEKSDYNAFVEATKDAPFASKVTQDFFNKFVEAWNLRENGDLEGAREIMEELGVPLQRGLGLRHNGGMMMKGKGPGEQQKNQNQ